MAVVAVLINVVFGQNSNLPPVLTDKPPALEDNVKSE